MTPENAQCAYCRDTGEDPERHLSAEQKAALDSQQVGPGGCPACQPESASRGALAHYAKRLRAGLEDIAQLPRIAHPTAGYIFRGADPSAIARRYLAHVPVHGTGHQERDHA